MKRLSRRLAVHLSPSRSPLGWAAVFIALVVTIVMWRQIRFGGLLLADDIWTSDLTNNNVPPRMFLGAELRAGRFPLWLPGSYGGLPLVPQGEAAAMSPITWVLYGAFHAITATTLTIALHMWIAGFGMVLLARRFGARMASAMAAGVGFMLCGFLIEHLKHMNMHHAAAFLPWMVYALDRLRESPGWRTALPFGVLSALQLSEGHPQMCFVSAFVLVPVLLYRLVRARRSLPRQSLFYAARLGGALLLAAAVMLLLAGAYLASGYELYALSERGAASVNRWEFCTHFDFLWQNIVTLFWAHALGNGANATYNARYGIFWESWLYVGAVCAAAALIALLAAVRHAVARRWRLVTPVLGLTLLAGFAFALMMGKHSPVYAALFDVVPGMTWFRFTHRFALILMVAVLLLAARGFDVVAVAARRRFGTALGRVCSAALLLLASGDLVYIASGHFYSIPYRSMTRPPATVRALNAIAPKEPYRLLSLFGSETHGEAFGRARGWQDYRPYVEQLALVQPSTHLYWGIESVNGYTSMVPHGVAKMLGSHTAMGMLNGPNTYAAQPPKECPRGRPRFSGACAAETRCSPFMARAYGAFNTRFMLTPAKLSECPGWTLRQTVPAGQFKIHLYENDLVLPRARVVSDVMDVPDVRQAAEALTRPELDPSRMTTRVRAPLQTKPRRPVAPAAAAASKGRSPKRGGTPPSPAEAAPVRECDYQSLGSSRRRVVCDLAEPGYLVIADTSYPGLQVTLNGAPVEPFVANGIHIGLELPAGKHLVELAFRPWYAPLVAAAAIGYAALLGLALGLWLQRTRRSLGGH